MVGGGRISLSLTVGVDRGHSNGWIYIYIYIFVVGETKMATGGGQISLPSPGRWGGSRPPLVAGSIFFFFFFFLIFFILPEKSPEVGGEWRWVAAFVCQRWVVAKKLSLELCQIFQLNV
jgi:hypothetical protein